MEFRLDIRPARLADADFLAWAVLTASRSHLPRGVWDVMIDRTREECLRYISGFVTCEPQTFCHYSYFLVAEADGRPAAALCGFDPRNGAYDAVAQVSESVLGGMGWSEPERWAALKRLAPLARCFPETVEGAWIIEHVATMPAMRRRGLAELLLAETLETGRRRGHRIAQITFFIGNTPAERAYQKAGFRFADEKRDPEFERIMGSPGLRRMLREI